MRNSDRMKVAPWQQKGRWYKFEVESDGTNITIIDKDDIDVSVTSSTAVTINVDNFHLLSFIVDSDNVSTTQTSQYSLAVIYLINNGRFALRLPPASCYSKAIVYFFGYFTE